MEERELKALQIAAKSKLTRRGKTWLVPSQSVRGAQYTVKLDPQEPECSCPDFECRKKRCKHIFAVEYTVEREQTADGETVFTESFKVTRRTYGQDWKAYNAAQQHEKRLWIKTEVIGSKKVLGSKPRVTSRCRLSLDLR